VEGSGSVVVFTSGGIGEGIVGVVYYLEFLSAFTSFGMICRDAVGVRPEG
jgi:hypothetical protein